MKCKSQFFVKEYKRFVGLFIIILWGKCMGRILLTGSNGFLGCNLAACLRKKYYIFGMGRNNETKSKVHSYLMEDITLDLSGLSGTLGETEYIIHVAADKSKEDFTDSLIDINCKGSYYIAKLAKKIKCKKFIYISSIPVIGIPPKEDLREDYFPVPNTMYHATKLAGEYIVQQLIKEGINVIILRVPSPVGYGMELNTIFPIFMQKAILGETIEIVGKGSRRQNYVDLRDLADAIEKCIELDVESGCYHIAAEKNVSNLELAEMCISCLHSSSEIEFINKSDALEGQEWNISIEKARKCMQYAPKYDVEQMIRYYGEKMRKGEV